MKTYEEVIFRMGIGMYHNHMGGSDARNGLSGHKLVSYIYDVSEVKVLEDAEEAFRSYCLTLKRENLL